MSKSLPVANCPGEESIQGPEVHGRGEGGGLVEEAGRLAPHGHPPKTTDRKVTYAQKKYFYINPILILRASVGTLCLNFANITCFSSLAAKAAISYNPFSHIFNGHQFRSVHCKEKYNNCRRSLLSVAKT